MSYSDFENILVPEDSGKQNPKESNMQTSIKNILLAVMAIKQCFGGKFSKPFKIYLGRDVM